MAIKARIKKTLYVVLAGIGGITVLGVVAVSSLWLVASSMSPPVVPSSQVVGLIGCLEANTCRIPRTREAVNEKITLSSVTLEENGVSIRYVSSRVERILSVMFTLPDGSKLYLEDFNGVGVVARVTQNIGKEIVSFGPKSAEFSEEYLRAQALYLHAMLLAEKRIIPIGLSERRQLRRTDSSV